MIVISHDLPLAPNALFRLEMWYMTVISPDLPVAPYGFFGGISVQKTLIVKEIWI